MTGMKRPMGPSRQFPAGTKLYRKALKSQYGTKSYREYFDVKPLKR